MRKTTYKDEESILAAIAAAGGARVVEYDPPYSITVLGCNPAWAIQAGADPNNNTTIEFDYVAIERALRALGATAEEASGLTDLLDQEGWGGAEYADPGQVGISDETMMAKLDWYRSDRA